MEYRRLGSAGLKVSALSFGAWVTLGEQVGNEVAEECLTAAYEAGVNFFDNAEAYAAGQAEIVMGKILAKKGWARDTLVISSKVFWGGAGPNQSGLSRKHVFESCHAALKRLQLDYLDLFFCHRPDYETPIEETVRAMHDLVTHGKVLYWGTSEWKPAQIMEAYKVAEQYGLHKPQMEQPQYNMFHRDNVERDLEPLYALGLGTTIWSPLASGLLTGKYSDGFPADSRAALEGYEWLREMFESEEAQRRIEKVKELAKVAGELDCTMAQLALAWCLKNPNVSTVITGASRKEQVAENMKALAVAEQLGPDVMEKIEAILDNKPAPYERFR